VETVTEALDFWPFRHEHLLDALARVDLRVETTTYQDDADRYLVVARRGD
jgi:hypothetical protein